MFDTYALLFTASDSLQSEKSAWKTLKWGERSSEQLEFRGGRGQGVEGLGKRGKLRGAAP